MLPIEKNARAFEVSKLCDGVLTSRQVANLLGENQKYVQEVMLKYDLPRLRKGAQSGKENHQYKSGRRIDRDGYVLVTAPQNHPFARNRAARGTKIIYEHRLLMEKKIGRYLQPEEVVDHIDGLRLHNHEDNLRLFENNAAHLRETISGKVPCWSREGKKALAVAFRRRHDKTVQAGQRVKTYDRMKKSGDARLIQILLAMISLDKDSQYLLGTRHHLEKAHISDFSHSNLKRELEKLYQKYE